MIKVDELQVLTEQMHLEADGDVDCRPVIRADRAREIPVTEAVMPNGKRIRLLKTLLSSACERNCYYCPFRAGRDMRRATFKPAEMAKTFDAMHRAGVVEGLFLSSGIIAGGVATQDKLIDTAEILRRQYQYRGYMHLKIMPGAERDQVERAMHLASRISVNLEGPNTERLQRLAPRKQFIEELVQPLVWAQEIRREQSPHRTWNGRWPSTVTQFVVGAVEETDLELLSTSEFLYRRARLARAYYSSFSPVRDTPFEDLPASNPRREHRLYQASFLLRDYGFELEEMAFDRQGNLPLEVDPKLAWARQHLQHVPVEVNRAGRQELLRVPGIGPKSASAILRSRRNHAIREVGALRKLGVHTNRAAPFLLLDGARPPRQLEFW